MKNRTAATPFALWMILFTVIPMLIVFYFAFTDEAGRFTLGNIMHIGDYAGTYIDSIWMGALATVICLVLAYPVALSISRHAEHMQRTMVLIVMLPMWMNFLLRTYAWISILSDNGLLNALLEKIGIGPLKLMYTDFAVMIGQICDFLPFMIIPIHTSLSKMDKSYVEAAYDLGANPFQTFFRVVFKLSIPGVLNGIIMVFLLSISTFVIPKLLGGGQFVLMGNLIENQFVSVGDWNFGSAISIVLAAIILLAIKWMKKIDTGENQS